MRQRFVSMVYMRVSFGEMEKGGSTLFVLLLKVMFLRCLFDCPKRGLLRPKTCHVTKSQSRDGKEKVT